MNYLALKDEASNFNGDSEHRGLSSFAPTKIASVSSTGDSRRYHPMGFQSDIFRSIDVSVVRRAAFITPPRADIQRHGGLSVHTARTSFTRGEITVHLDESFACSRSFVFKKVGEHIPANISNGFGQAMIFHHAFYVQILNGYDLVFVNQSMRKFVQPVLASICGMFMRLCHEDPGFVSGVTPLHFARKFLLLSFQVLRRLRQVAWVVELRSVAGDGKMGQPNIYADDLAVEGSGRGDNASLGQHRNQVSPSLVAAHSDGLDRSNNLTVDHRLDVSQLRQKYLASIHNLHALRVLDGLLAVLRLEIRVFGATLKEVHDRHVTCSSIRLEAPDYVSQQASQIPS